MGKIVQFPFQARPKFSLRKVKASRKKDPEQFGQMNLFAPPSTEDAKVVRFHSDKSLFEEALLVDDTDQTSAEELYWKAISAGDCVADSYCNLGILEYRKGNKSKAIDYLSKSLKHDPRHFESHFNLANLYFDVENLELARLHYEVAAEIKPDFAGIFYNLGLVLAMLNEIELAIRILVRYKELVSAEKAAEADQLLGKLKDSLAQ